MGKAVVDVFWGRGGGDDVGEKPPPTALEKFCRACWIDLSWEVAIVFNWRLRGSVVRSVK